MSKVYFASARSMKWKYDDSMPGKLERLLKEFNLSNYFEPKEWVAVKTHFGSEGAHRIVRPIFLRKVVDALKGLGAKPFVTDTVRIKGHIQAGYAGAIKNIAMGGVSSKHRECGWKCGRGAMHTLGEGMLAWDEKKCELCYQCMEICPLDAIKFINEELKWDSNECWRCGRGERACQAGALSIP